MENIEVAKKLKGNIRTLIENGQFEEAKILLDGYEKIEKNDIEVYSIKGILSMIEGDLDEAKNRFLKGLESQPYNEDLLFNLSYLMNIMNKSKDSMEIFCKLKLFNKNSIVKIKDIGFKPSYINKQNLKVIHGTMEIANQMHTISSGLKARGVDSKTVNYYPNYLGYDSDYVLDISKLGNTNLANDETKKIASKLISHNDVFHFHFGTSLSLDGSDLCLLKELNKKVIMHYWGSDVRLYSKAKQMNIYAKVKQNDEEKIKKSLEFLSKYIDNCIVPDHELSEYVKDYHSSIYYVRQAIDLDKYKFADKVNNKKLLLVHAPTSPEIKGSKFILEAIEELKYRYDFEFQLVQGLSHEEAIEVYRKADLIIDQIIIGSYGLFAVEAMAMGKPVICWITDFMKEKYPKELPIISANPDNIREKIEYLLKNRELLNELGVKGRLYVEKYHDSRQISRKVLDIYEKI